MGAYYLVVNPTKRQYLDPIRFGEGIKFEPLLRGEYCLMALKLLIADCFRRNESLFSGAWVGDPVILASDDSGLPDPGGLVTATPDDPELNLHALASLEFTDISYRAIAEICLDKRDAAGLAARANEDGSLLIDLGATLTQYHLPALEHALNSVVGRSWREAYNRAQAELAYWHPLPPIDWPL
jgi:hypothetical protein